MQSRCVRPYAYIYCACIRGDRAAILARLAEARAAPPEPEAHHGLLLCLCEAVYAAQVLGDTEHLATLSDEMERHAARSELPLTVLGHVERVRAHQLMLSGFDDRAIAAAHSATDCFERAGDLRNACRIAILEGHAAMMLGDLPRAEQVLRAVHTSANRLGIEQVLFYCLGTLGETLVRAGRRVEAREIFDVLLARNAGRGDPRAAGTILITKAILHLADGDHSTAEAAVDQGLALLAGQSPIEAWGLCVQARTYLARGEVAEAAALAAQALDRTTTLRGVYDEAYVWLALVECLDGVDPARQQVALDRGLSRLGQRLQRIVDPALRRTILTIPEWRTLLARGRCRPLPEPLGTMSDLAT